MCGICPWSGLLEILPRAGNILTAYRLLKKRLSGPDKPDLLVLIDYPDFNLRIAAIAKKNKVPVLYYISPQIWAWRQGRAKKIARLVDTMAVIFPFEAPFYEKVGLMPVLSAIRCLIMRCRSATGRRR